MLTRHSPATSAFISIYLQITSHDQRVDHRCLVFDWCLADQLECELEGLRLHQQ